eukprot:12128215-Alexandrium_andersonii.AAC.1
MSASLVGSEMCIRDSAFVAATAAWIFPLAFGMRLLAASCLGKGLAVSVSYTHLTLPTICSV